VPPGVRGNSNCIEVSTLATSYPNILKRVSSLAVKRSIVINKLRTMAKIAVLLDAIIAFDLVFFIKF
jgi:hypothetical protein